MEKIRDAIINRMKRYWESLGKSKAVIGISGGKDSTVCAALCVRAFGADNVISVSMPHTVGNDELTRKVIEATGLKGGFNHIRQSIDQAEKFLTLNVFFRSPEAEINVKPRLRTALEYYIAQALAPHALVVCTSNFDEILLGWYTLWGDAGDYAPINRLHVSEVIELGRTLGIPEDLLMIPPSDGLTGKTDEENLGFTYKDVEKACRKTDVVWDDICPDRHLGELAVLGFLGINPKAKEPGSHFETNADKKIYERWKNNKFKQEMMSIPGPGDDIRQYLDERIKGLKDEN